MRPIVREGDLVLFCEHADVEDDNHIDISAKACSDQPFHWYNVWDKSAEFTSIDQDTGAKETVQMKWMCICNKCEKAEVGKSLEIRGRHAHWIGPSPNITIIQ